MSEIKMQIQDQVVSVPGGKVFARSWIVNSNIAPIFLLHDSLGCVELWRGFPELLARKLKRNVIAYDRLGFGKSSARQEIPSVNFIEEQASIFFLAICEQLQIKNFALLGYSVGGAMAFSIAAKNTKSCEFVISESTQAFVEERTLQGINSAKLAFLDPKHFNKLKKYHGQKADWVLRAWTEIWTSQAFASWNLKTVLETVDCEVLTIHGDNDEYGSIEFPTLISKNVRGPSEIHILENCGHMPHKEYESTVLELVDDFVNRCDPKKIKL